MTKAPEQRHRCSGAFTYCAPEGIRTPNLLIRSQMLYPLSYGRAPFGSHEDTVPDAFVPIRIQSRTTTPAGGDLS